MSHPFNNNGKLKYRPLMGNHMSSQLKDYPNVRSLNISLGLCLLELIHTRHQSVPSYFKLGWQNFYFSMFKQLMLENRSNSKRRKKNEKTKDFFFSDSIRNVPKFYWNGDFIFILDDILIFAIFFTQPQFLRLKCSSGMSLTQVKLFNTLKLEPRRGGGGGAKSSRVDWGTSCVRDTINENQ